MRNGSGVLVVVNYFDAIELNFMKRVPAKTPRPWKEARGIKFQPLPSQPKAKPESKSVSDSAGTGEAASKP